MSEHVSEPAPETDEAEVSHADNGWATPDDAVIDTFDGEDEDADDASEATVIGTGVPTQIAHPAKATARTGFASVIGILIGLFGVLPLVLDALNGVEGLPPELYGILGTVGGGVLVINMIITRLMAIPQINELLGKIGLGTGVEKE